MVSSPSFFGSDSRIACLRAIASGDLLPLMVAGFRRIRGISGWCSYIKQCCMLDGLEPVVLRRVGRITGGGG